MGEWKRFHLLGFERKKSRECVIMGSTRGAESTLRSVESVMGGKGQEHRETGGKGAKEEKALDDVQVTETV